MAFISSVSTSFLGTRMPTQSVARVSTVRPRVIMTATEPPRVLPNIPVSDRKPELVYCTPPYKVLDLQKGDRFNFVKYYVDDFTTKPYFDGLTGAGVKVAVLDTGIDSSHPALKNRIDKVNSKNYTKDNNSNPSDYSDGNGHGTHCAGIIAAEDQNQVMYGIAPGAEIVVKKVLSDNGEPFSELNLVPLRIAQGIRDATAEGCQVISMSLGLTERYYRSYQVEMSEMYYAVQEALAAGVTICVAAGNSGRFDSSNTIEPPGAYGGVITVAAHDDSGNRSSFSSYGGELDFMAPGEVMSTYLTTRNSYAALSGTSMATPLVAGLAALLIEAGPKSGTGALSFDLQSDMNNSGYRARNNFEVRELLRLLSERPNDHNREVGYGRLTRAYQYVNGQI